MDLGLKGLNVLITGGSKGIGRRCADYFADEGANVSICARDKATVDETVSAISKKGVKGFGMAVDVAHKAQLESWVAESAKALGGIDIVVANVSALAVDDSEEAWQKEFEVDMMHTVRLVNLSLPHLEKSKAPSITVISSVSGREIDFTGPAYGAFKAALIHYAHGLAFKLAPKMIRVRLTRKYLFQRRCLGAYRTQFTRSIQRGFAPQSNRSHGNAGRSGSWRGVFSKPRLIIHNRD